MSCILHVNGTDSEIDEFLATSHLKTDRVWHKGEPRSLKSTHQDTGFTVVVSDTDMSDLHHQIGDAVQFLKDNQAELERLQHLMGIEIPWLDFGIENRDVFGQYDRFPPELLRLAGNLNIGIEISRYQA